MSIVFIISAPSGSGKSTLVKELMDKDSRAERRLAFSVSVTTRAPRSGEVDGRDYRFLTQDQFFDLRDRDELLEWAEVFGNFYGTSRQVLRDAERDGKDLILDIDVQGAAQLREKLPGAVTIFILPPSRQELEVRLRRRSSDADEVIDPAIDAAANLSRRGRRPSFRPSQEPLESGDRRPACRSRAGRRSVASLDLLLTRLDVTKLGAHTAGAGDGSVEISSGKGDSTAGESVFEPLQGAAFC